MTNARWMLPVVAALGVFRPPWLCARELRWRFIGSSAAQLSSLMLRVFCGLGDAHVPPVPHVPLKPLGF